MTDTRWSWPELPHVLTELQNPVTRFIVKLVPPVEIVSREDLDDVVEKFEEYCKRAWENGRQNPESVTDIRGWLMPNAG